jgi:hypothetical protein
VTYSQAVRSIWLYRIVGGLVVVFGLTWLLVSVLTWAYFLPAQNPMETAVYRGIRNIIAQLYQATNPYIGFIWKNPLPFNGQFADIATNKWAYLVYGVVLLGVERVAAAKKLASMIRQAKNNLAQAQMNQSVAAHYGQKTQAPKQNTPPPQIPPPGWFNQFHVLYVAPIVVGIFLFIVQKIFT